MAGLRKLSSKEVVDDETGDCYLKRGYVWFQAIKDELQAIKGISISDNELTQFLDENCGIIGDYLVETFDNWKAEQ